MSCNKNAYESEGMALVIIDELIAHNIKGSKNLSVYKCDECEMWHLTSNS